ncbi:cytochrome c oxidase assembly protein [Geminicoccus flavidas]|uniref:cytochrome c oxidase assembly protein n=1 Tax=Geminicoccus flavidas TaxID=2506407 RepID=UPI0013573CF6|nr:cytochrome c oxidase assembly protein [Geminicoccus flavidas]
MTRLALLALLLAPLPASAHGGAAGYLTAEGAWSFPLEAMIPLYLAAGLYLVGTWRLWRRAGHGRGVRHWQAACFWCGWTVLALCITSPLGLLSEQLFVAHMIEHELMVIVAAPLLVVSRPLGAFAWALPIVWRRALGRIGRWRSLAASWRWLTGAGVATLLHAATLWAWHQPDLFAAALKRDWVHWLQHVSFLVTALLFWWSIIDGRARTYGPALFWLFVTILQSAFLGILLALSPRPWIPRQTDLLAGWGLTPLQDQQLAGFVMWVPGGMVYVGVALALAAAWIRHAGTEARRRQTYA